MDVLTRYRKQVEGREDKNYPTPKTLRSENWFNDYEQRRQKLVKKYCDTSIATLIKNKEEFSVARCIMPEQYDGMRGLFLVKSPDTIGDIVDAIRERFPNERFIVNTFAYASRDTNDKITMNLVVKVNDAQFEKTIVTQPYTLNEKDYFSVICFKKCLGYTLVRKHKEFQQRRYYQQMTTRMFTQLPEAVCLDVASYCHTLKPSPPARV